MLANEGKEIYNESKKKLAIKQIDLKSKITLDLVS